MEMAGRILAVEPVMESGMTTIFARRTQDGAFCVCFGPASGPKLPVDHPSDSGVLTAILELRRAPTEPPRIGPQI